VVAKRILIIDDESGFCDVVKDTLGEVGYHVEAPRLLASAIARALMGNHDLIILDLRMPGIDGLDIAKLFLRRRIPTPILVISGFIGGKVSEELKHIGIMHTLPKPSGVAQLRHAVASALA
jgi:DNA-binding NtrC family response regulator